MENKLSKLQADQALWQDIFLKNAELENELKKEKEWRVQMQASNETKNENVTQLSKDLLFYKKVANVSKHRDTTKGDLMIYDGCKTKS